MSSVEHDPGRVTTRLSKADMAWLRARGRVGRRWLSVAIMAPLVSGCLTVAQAFLLATILQRAIVEHVPSREQVPAILGLVGFVLLRALLAWTGERAGSQAAETIKLAVRHDLFAALMARRPAWMREKTSGVLTNQIVDQVEALDAYFARFLPAMIAAAFLPIAFAVILMPVDLVVGALFLITAPLIPVFMALAGWGAESASRRHMTALSRLSGLFADRLRGLLVLKLFGRAEDEVARVREASDEVADRTLSVLKIAFLSSAVLEFFAALGVAGVALYVGLTYLGLIDLHPGTLTLQAGLFCLFMAPEIYLPLRTLAAHYHDRAAAKAAVADMSAVFEGLPDVVDGAQAASRPATVRRGAIAVDVSDLVVMAPGRGPVLEGAAIHAAAGEHVALLGPSGIGKSTLIDVLARFRDWSGRVELDGEDLAAIDETALRADIAVLNQRPRLFHGTIASNIRLGRLDASDEDVRRAAERACVTDFADALPDGLATTIGERGRGVSGGEAQRIALARIFLRDPGLILLDEPTAHLDSATETRIVDAILDFAVGRSLIIATHSVAVANRMDRIYRIAGGQILPVPHRPTSRLPNLPKLGAGDAP
ncbi:thiol reductant ABC exporter subunit CydD [Kaistia dalseonensis]|uniref:ATP-binding cassette subfamily C protein CydD n=1 Tax=Kaistia dalseonensis TaxID=410840 RepID=A0ABU0H107_9HYPH|nr:thiol reductant ABC exporter subunit CydD [Kaistia dalseonensis]MCX5493440.1 thiol reductant ABC exporter subunit CydD [Kaistia dalseonensis]MDQ0435999.1 ATP-binding cassette subfamily C protein CydD [Kaistia dalseonensis]